MTAYGLSVSFIADVAALQRVCHHPRLHGWESREARPSEKDPIIRERCCPSVSQSVSLSVCRSVSQLVSLCAACGWREHLAQSRCSTCHFHRPVESESQPVSACVSATVGLSLRCTAHCDREINKEKRERERGCPGPGERNSLS